MRTPALWTSICPVSSLCCLSIVWCCAASGCGGGGSFAVAPVHGKVTCNGEVLTSGRVMFYPVLEDSETTAQSGKSALGEINENGEYTLSTYGRNDGAVVGRHRVVVWESQSAGGGGEEDDDDDDEDGESDADENSRGERLCGGGQLELVVESGDNTLDIELTE